MEEQLRLLAKRLQEEGADVSVYDDGAMERAVKYGIQDCMQRIGEHLEEVLNMDDEQLKNA